MSTERMELKLSFRNVIHRAMRSVCQWLCFALLAGGATLASAQDSRTICGQAVTSASYSGSFPAWLDGTAQIYGWDAAGASVYLGLISSSEFKSDSILNQFAQYGSSFASGSIFNSFASYGSDFSSRSPCNSFAQSSGVPQVWRNGVFIGYLTKNSFIAGAIDPAVLVAALLKQAYGVVADVTAPSVPGGVSTTVISATQINLSWTAATDNVGVATYKVYVNGTLANTFVASTLGITHTGLSPATSYSYAVAACDAAGNCSALSNTVSGKTLIGAQAITFNTAPSLIVGGTGTVGASGGASGNAVKFTSETPNVCTIQGSTVTGVAAGSCGITANQPGSNSYGAAAPVTQTFAVGPAPQTITFGTAPSVVVGGTGAVSATGGASGNAVTFTSATSGVCTVAGGTVTGVTAGTCSITASQMGSSNYSDASPATQSFTVGVASGYSLGFVQGWNLLGNSINRTVQVAAVFGDPATVVSVWKWDAAAQAWQFYSPQMDAAALTSYAAGKGYGVLSVINPGEGYWVNAKMPGSLGNQPGPYFVMQPQSLVKGWNLTASGEDASPPAFNVSLSATPPAPSTVPLNLTTLWAWDSSLSRWYFYAPTLERDGGLLDYIVGKGYLDFAAHGKTLGNGVGFWVNKP